LIKSTCAVRRRRRQDAQDRSSPVSSAGFDAAGGRRPATLDQS